MASKPKAERSAIDVILEGMEPTRVTVVSDEEYWEWFDQTAKTRLGMTGEEFLQRWDDGEWNEDPDQPGVITLHMMMKDLGPDYRPKACDWD